MKKLIAGGLVVLTVVIVSKLWSMEFMFPYSYGLANLVLKTLIGLLALVSFSAIAYWLKPSRTVETIGIIISSLGLMLVMFFCLFLA